MKPFIYYLIYFLTWLCIGLTAIAVLFLFDASNLWIHYSLINITFFFLITIASFSIFYFSFSTKNKSAVLLALVLSFGGKLIFAGLLVLILQRIFELQPITFFVPFAISYLLFTIPEVVALVKIGDRLSEKEKHENKG